MALPFRTGLGFDVHRLVEGRDLWIGGVKIEHSLGLLGHSDADVAIHALCDAMLGAAALRDIGFHFPDSDPAYKGIDSKILLRRTVELIGRQGYAIGNVDCTLCLQRPKIRPFIDDMRHCLAEILELDVDDLSIKATTTEQLGFEGREEGVSAYATVLVYKL